MNSRTPYKPGSELRSSGDDGGQPRGGGAEFPKFYTIERIADYLVVSTRTVRRWIDDELLVAHRINRVVRIANADFLAFLAIRRDD
jgi:excisionase family DNA binding protein